LVTFIGEGVGGRWSMERRAKRGGRGRKKGNKRGSELRNRAFGMAGGEGTC